MPRSLAHLLSVIFHPLLIASYMLLFLLLVNPYLFGVSHFSEQFPLLGMQFFNTFLVPALMVLMLKQLEVIESIQLHQREERIFPYIITGIFYLSMTAFFLHNSNIPTAFVSFMLGSTIALFLGFFINLFVKISAHAIGMGGFVGMVSITMWLFSYETFALTNTIHLNMLVPVLLVILLAGLVGTARLKLNAHTLQDLYGGYLVGFSAQFIALRFLF